MIETTDFRKSEHYTLSIRLTADGFCFSLFNPLVEREKAFSVEMVRADEDSSLCGNLRRVVQQTEWMSQPFGHVHVVVETIRHTLVPMDFFDEDQASVLFHHCLVQNDNEVVLFDTMPLSNSAMLYGMDESAYNYLQEVFPAARFHSKAGSLLDLFASKSRQDNTRKLFVNFGNNIATFYAYQQGLPLLCNSQAIEQAANAAYYTLLCWKELDLDQQHDELLLSGNIYQPQELLPLLQRYIQNVVVMNDAQHIDLQNISLCE